MRSGLTDLQTEMRTGLTQVRGQLDGTAAGLDPQLKADAALISMACAQLMGFTVVNRKPGGLFTEDGGPSNPGASGAVNRLLPPNPSAICP